MPINSFDRLQKDIDALTYNARAVLQALQESALAGGTAKGFRIVRADHEITLTRVDIYRLYTFYREWEVNNFALSDETDASGRSILGFNTIRTNHDKKPVRDDAGVIIDGGATSTALAKHGRLMYLNRENESMYSDDSYWYTLIASAANPKLISNSAPIPINLRTPMYDPNLSTTHYNSHPTYLLPNAYHLLDIVGYAGDGKDHYLDGDRWSISATKLLKISAEYITAGTINNANIFKTEDKRVDKNAFVWGYNTFAPAKYATAGGMTSAAIDTAAIAIGNNAFASMENSVVVGGLTNQAINSSSGVFAGSYNSAFGHKSVILGGQSNITGEPPYEFELAYVDGSSECFSDCVSTCEGAENSTTSVSIAGYNIIRIKQAVSAINIKAGDTVLMYAFKTKSSGYPSADHRSIGGSYYPTVKRVVTSISTDPSSSGYSIISFDLGLPKAYHVGGFISRTIISSNGVNPLLHAETNGIGSPLGYNSATVGGLYLIASGIDQLVVGRANRHNTGTGWNSTYDARFIVGSGGYQYDSSGKLSLKRKNILEVYDNAIVLSLNGLTSDSAAFSGILAGSNKKISNSSTLNAVQLMWAGESGIYVGVARDYDSIKNVGVMLSSNKTIGVSAPYTYIAASNTSFVTAKNAYITASAITKLESTNSGGSASLVLTSDSSGQNAILRSTTGQVSVDAKNIVLGYRSTIKISGPRNGSYGTFFSPASTYDSFTTTETGVALKPNTIFKSSIAEVTMPATSSLYLSDEFVPDTYLGLLSAGTATRKSHVMTLAGTGGNVMQMMWGECTPNNLTYNGSNQAWTGNVCFRKGIVTNGSGSYTPWEPVVFMSDMERVIQEKYSSTSYTKNSIHAVYATKSGGGNSGYIPDWISISASSVAKFDISFERVGSLTLCTCEYKLNIPTTGTEDGSYVMIELDVGSVSRQICKPYSTSIGSAMNLSDVSLIHPHHVVPTTQLYAVFMDGYYTKSPSVTADGIGDVTQTNSLIRIFVPVMPMNETAVTLNGRFSLTYKNLTGTTL